MKFPIGGVPGGPARRSPTPTSIDLLILGDNVPCRGFIKSLRSRFKTTPEIDIWSCTAESPLSFLGHEIWFAGGEIHISQSRYARDIVSRFSDLIDDKRVDSLKNEHFQFAYLNDPECVTPLDKETHSRFRSIIGGLMYLVLCTRVD